MTTTSRQAGQALRQLPSIDAFTQRDTLCDLPRRRLLRVARAFLDEVREGVLAGRRGADEVAELFASGAAEAEVRARCTEAGRLRHRRVVNATGIVLHTGIGRAPLAAPARRAIAEAGGYALVEVDPHTGERNQRESAVAELLAELTGAPGALVVNNNAAATTLVLAALSAGREAVVSRGQLVEIGGGFRMPDVMAEAGCRMVEVGTTNRTHLRDFARAITGDTAVLLLVHTSNFRVLGFTKMPAREELVALGRERGCRVIEDLGSGLLLSEPVPGIDGEPCVPDVVSSGLDATCFSGDKLLGGPQCGIVVGDAELVAAVRAHPLYRAFRCDKLTLAALEATLRIYLDGEPLREIPTLRMIAADPDRLAERAGALAGALGRGDARVVRSESFAGSGANPARPLPSWAVAIPGGDAHADRLRAPGPTPAVFARCDDAHVLLDLRTLDLEDLDEVAGWIRGRLSD